MPTLKFFFFILTFFITQVYAIGQNLNTPIKFLALGDSYTIGHSVSSDERWPNQLQDSLKGRGYDTLPNTILATTGWTTANLLQAIRTNNLDNDYNLVSILIGVNNFYQGKPVNQFRKELPIIIDSALSLCHNDTNALFIVTIPDYGYTPFGQNNQAEISEKTDLYNGIKDSVAAIYNIPVYNITPVSRKGLDEPGLVASDGLHPSGKQYTLWVQHILQNMLTITTSFNNEGNLLKAWKGNDGHYLNVPAQGKVSAFSLAGQLLKTFNNENKSEYFYNSKSAIIWQVITKDQVLSIKSY